MNQMVSWTSPTLIAVCSWGIWQLTPWLKHDNSELVYRSHRSMLRSFQHSVRRSVTKTCWMDRNTLRIFSMSRFHRVHINIALLWLEGERERKRESEISHGDVQCCAHNNAKLFRVGQNRIGGAVINLVSSWAQSYIGAQEMKHEKPPYAPSLSPALNRFQPPSVSAVLRRSTLNVLPDHHLRSDEDITINDTRAMGPRIHAYLCLSTIQNFRQTRLLFLNFSRVAAGEH